MILKSLSRILRRFPEEIWENILLQDQKSPSPKSPGHNPLISWQTFSGAGETFSKNHKSLFNWHPPSIKESNLKLTRPSVNYAKDWLDHSFLFPGLVWFEKRVLFWIWSLGGSQQPFFCVLGHFRHGHEQTNNRVILVQACPWPVWEGSLLQF